MLFLALDVVGGGCGGGGGKRKVGETPTVGLNFASVYFLRRSTKEPIKMRNHTVVPLKQLKRVSLNPS